MLIQKLPFLKLILFLTICLSASIYGNSNDPFYDEEDEFKVGGDIFSDFNEDSESSQVFEDERFYRYGRFFSFNMGLGMTRFTGNRGKAYEDDDPTFHVSFNYFINFELSVTLGLEYSKHTMIIDTFVNSYRNEIIGAVDVKMLRPFMGMRYYIPTANLGTAITYSNPYFTGRVEYWYQTNKFAEAQDPFKQSGGGIGLGLGFGFEFPVVLKERYLNVEFLVHQVNFFDKNTDDYQQVPNQTGNGLPAGEQSLYGYDDLTGYAWSVVVSYNFTW